MQYLIEALCKYTQSQPKTHVVLNTTVTQLIYFKGTYMRQM